MKQCRLNPSNQWTRFASEFPSDSRLEMEGLLALPLPLINQIERRCKGLFTKLDSRFERGLRRHSATGFWNQQPVFSRILDHELLSEDRRREVEDDAIVDAAEMYSEQSNLEARDILTNNGVFGHGDVETRLTRWMQITQRLEAEIHESLKGYLGWLVTEGKFIYDIYLLRRIMGNVSSPRQLPGWQVDQMRRRVGRGKPRRGDMETNEILRCWSLDRLVTWELPEPIVPRYRPGEKIPQNGLNPAGFSFFVPWPLLANRTLDLTDFSAYHRRRNDLSFLQPWLDGVSKWGAERFARMFDLFVYRELALEQRYGDRLRGHGVDLDLAFAAYWEPEANQFELEKRLETVKKIRAKLRQRRRQAEVEVSRIVAQLDRG